MKTYTLTTEETLPRPRDEVFEFFSDAHNLEALTPPWLSFCVETPAPISMRAGALIDYRLKVRGISMRWRSKIMAWEPPFRFVDEQVLGPYRFWRHEHTFEEKGGGTLVRDQVEYAVPGWILAPLFHRLWVRRDVERIFRFRAERLIELCGGAA